MQNQSYDPSFAHAAADRLRETMTAKCEADTVNRAGSIGAGTGAAPRRPDIISGIDIQFLANGFMVAPRMEYLGGPGSRQIAHVARDRDELLKLVGEMIDAHAK